MFITVFADMAEDIYCRLNSANGPKRPVNPYELPLKTLLSNWEPSLVSISTRHILILKIIVEARWIAE